MTSDAFQRLVKVAAEAAEVSAADIMGDTRSAPVVRARQALWFVLHRVACEHLTTIGTMAGRDHSTIHNGVARTVQRVREGDEDVRCVVDAVSAAFLGGRRDERRTLEDAHALLDASQRSVPAIEALGYAIVAAAQRLSDAVDDARAGLVMVEALRASA